MSAFPYHDANADEPYYEGDYAHLHWLARHFAPAALSLSWTSTVAPLLGLMVLVGYRIAQRRYQRGVSFRHAVYASIVAGIAWTILVAYALGSMATPFVLFGTCLWCSFLVVLVPISAAWTEFLIVSPRRCPCNHFHLD